MTALISFLLLFHGCTTRDKEKKGIIVCEASGIARIDNTLLIVGDDADGRYFVLPLRERSGPIIPIDPETVEEVVLPHAELAMDLEAIDELADGRVYTGRQAFELGLVDELGIPADAIAKAAELGGIEDEPRIIELKSVPSFLDALYSFQTRSMVPTLDELIGWAGVPSLEFRLVRP